MNKIKHYHQETKSLPYIFFFSLPMLILYELLILSLNKAEWLDVRNGADVLVKRFLRVFGLEGFIGLSLALLVILVVFVFKELKKRSFQLRADYLAGMLVESILYAVLLRYLLVIFASVVSAAAIMPVMMWSGRRVLLPAVVLSLGAGIYEELVFRVVLLQALIYVSLRLIGPRARKGAVTVLAVTVGALIFSLSHYIGALGDSFRLSSFIQRVVAGIFLSGVFLFRGYGIAAWTHALFDLYVVLL
ncbi:MAG: CPBP family glutamic-type intramembrane protease [bacterium]|nr:CPBP family glutamic-type intramembrane protease [bacterium]